MWWLLVNSARTYAPYIIWPVSAVIGFAGYHIEKRIRGDKQTPYKTISITEEREERRLQQSIDKDMTNVESLKLKNFLESPTIFDKNK